MTIDISLLTANDDFAAAAADWSDLLTRCVEPNTFLSHEWLYNWWIAYKPPAELRILIAYRGAQLLGIAPLMLERQQRLGIPIRVLRFIGDGTSETDHMSWLVDRNEASSVRDALHHAVSALPWDVAQFNQMPDGAANSVELLNFAKQQKWRIKKDEVPCPRCNLPASYEALLAALPSRFRTSLRSARRKLEKEHQMEFGLHENPDEIPEALDTFFANHASRWQAKGQQGVFEDACKRDFYARLTPALLARGWLRFFYLKLDGRIVAQQYCFEHDGTIMLLQEGFDFAWAQKNVGNTLRGLVFEHLIEAGAARYDFLAGSSRHKANWADESPLDLRIECSRGWRGALYAIPPGAVAALKERLRPLRERLRPKREATP